MQRFFYLHLRAASQALRTLLQQPLSSLLGLAMLGLAVALPVCLYLLVSSAQQWSQGLTVKPEITVFMELNAERTDVVVVDEHLRQHKLIADYEFISREQALKVLLEKQNLQDIGQALGGNPLPDAFIIRPKELTPEQMEQLAVELSHLPLVENTQFDAGWARKLAQILAVLQHFTLVLGASLAVTLLLVTHNMIRMQILAHRDAIEVSKLIGAPNPFIRRPFLYLAVWQGGIAAALGWGLAQAFIATLNPLIADFAALYHSQAELHSLNLEESVLLVVSIIGLSCLTAAWTCTRLLRKLEPR